MAGPGLSSGDTVWKFGQESFLWMPFLYGVYVATLPAFLSAPVPIAYAPFDKALTILHDRAIACLMKVVLVQESATWKLRLERV